MYLLIMAPFMLLGWWAQSRVTSSFATWARVPASSGRTGAEIARAILDRNGLNDVEVRHVAGSLSDHYDPRSRTVNLSDDVFGGRSIASAAVAAHEVGHAMQHAQAYVPMTMRSAVFPAASFGSAAFMPLFLIGMVLMAIGSAFGGTVMLVAIAMFAFGVVFQLVTLPVEFDASARARRQLGEMAIMTSERAEMEGTSAVLGAAAMTYVAAALMSVAQLAYFAMTFLGGDD